MLQLNEDHLARVRRICSGFPGTTEKLSHGEPTFFTGGRVYVMFANDHHGDGHVAVWVAAPEGEQASLIHTSPGTYFKPPYVGVKGWIGIELSQVGDDELMERIAVAWQLIARKKRTSRA
ncbi:MAG: MmcQ/YjbR family DNA-binding protein [Bryobacteraceae bacterium]|nr:MmcQ/YjbR family DNA-binding protein [Bryobacteraceae bacterium]